MGSRQRPLQTCWVSILEISSKAYTTASRNFNGGNSAVHFTSPSVICALQCQILAILAFFDDRILRIESLAETIFPPSKHLFDRVDGLVKAAEALPETLEDKIEKFPALVHQVPFLERAFVHCISWLGFLMTVMADWGIMGVKHKEIDVGYRRNDGLIGKRKRKKTRKMDVRFITGKEGSNPDDQLLNRQEAVVPPQVDVQTVMIDGLMVQQEPDRLTILTSNEEAMNVQDSNKKNDDVSSRGFNEKDTNIIDRKLVDETKEKIASSGSNEEPVKIAPRDINDQTFESNRHGIVQEGYHKTFLTSTEKPKPVAEGTNDQTFTSNGPSTTTNENAPDHQTLRTSNDDTTIIQESDEINHVVQCTDQKSTSNNPKKAEGTEEVQGIANEENDDDSTFTSNNGSKIEHEADDNQTFLTTTTTTIPRDNGESEIDPSVTSNGSAFVSETDDTAMDSDCSQIKSSSYPRDIFAPFPNEPADQTTSVPGGVPVPGSSSWSNVVRGSYKDVLEKGKNNDESVLDIPRHKGSKQDKSSRRQAGKKAARGGGQEESRSEGKGRRKGKRKKADGRVESFSDCSVGKKESRTTKV